MKLATPLTALPWKVAYSDGSGPDCITDAAEHIVCSIGFHGDPECRGELDAHELANRDLIVVAVNDHARLSADLADAVAALSALLVATGIVADTKEVRPAWERATALVARVEANNA